MALKLFYRSTFIDIDDDSIPILKPRSQSQPPSPKPCGDFADAQLEEKQLSNYVATLGHRSEQLGMLIWISGHEKVKALLPEPDVAREGKKQACSETLSARSPCSSRMKTERCRFISSTSTAPSTQHAESDISKTGVEALPSRGSMGHPEVCRRPCIYFARGDCQNGLECGFCHLDHGERKAHLDKKNRELLKTMSSAEVLALVLNLARLRALETGILSEAFGVLHVLDIWSSTRGLATFQTPEMRRLHSASRTLPFSGLITIVLKKHLPAKSQEDADFIEQLQDALAQMGK